MTNVVTFKQTANDKPLWVQPDAVEAIHTAFPAGEDDKTAIALRGGQLFIVSGTPEATARALGWTLPAPNDPREYATASNTPLLHGPSTRGARCEICRFWEAGDETCRRAPPIWITNPTEQDPLDGFWGWPTAKEIEWCGEFHPFLADEVDEP